jgi:hypothetical protein
MRSLFAAAALFLSSLALTPTPALAEGCYLCSSGGSCNQCSYGDKDTADARKACEKKGCKITGTASCSKASNVKVCANQSTRDGALAQLDRPAPWCSRN